jgi:hypothetical protein
MFGSIRGTAVSSVKRLLLGVDQDGLRPGDAATRSVAEPEPEPYPAELPWEARKVLERRREPRYLPLGRRAYVGWWVGGAFETAEAETDNLSRGGAALRVERFPPDVGLAWVCPICRAQANWYAVHVVSLTEADGCGRLLRVALANPLGYDVFKSLVWGFPGDETPALTTAGARDPPPRR